MKKITLLLLVLVLITTTLGFSLAEGENAYDLPIAKEPITLTALTSATGGVSAEDWNDLYVWKELEARTGIHIDWIVSSDPVAMCNTMEASGDLPDILYGTGVWVYDFGRYVANESVIALDDLIKDNAPNLYKAIYEDTQVLAGVTQPTDGKVYSVPRIEEREWNRYYGKMWYYKPVLDELNDGKIPTTYEEFKSYLYKVKEAHPEMIPWYADDYNWYHWQIGPAYGIYLCGGLWAAVNFDKDTGRCTFYQSEDGFRYTLSDICDYFADGIIPTWESGKYGTQNIQLQEGSAAVVICSNVGKTNAGENWDKYIPATEPLIALDGSQYFSAINPKVSQCAAFAITSNCKYVEEAIRWMDYQWSPEGQELLMFGEKDVHHTVNEGGECPYLWTDFVLNNPDGLTYSQACGTFTSVLNNGNMPLICKPEYLDQRYDAEDIALWTKIADDLKQYQYPGYAEQLWFTQEEVNEINFLYGDIGAIIDQSYGPYVLGQQSFDNWNERREKLYDAGLDRYNDIMSNCYTFWRDIYYQ